MTAAFNPWLHPGACDTPCASNIYKDKQFLGWTTQNGTFWCSMSHARWLSSFLCLVSTSLGLTELSSQIWSSPHPKWIVPILSEQKLRWVWHSWNSGSRIYPSGVCCAAASQQNNRVTSSVSNSSAAGSPVRPVSARRGPPCHFKYQSKPCHSWKVKLHNGRSSWELFV